MRRVLIFAVAAFASVGVVGCGDDADPALPPVMDPGLAPDAGAFSIQVTNVGTACSADAGCQGPGARCMNVSSTGTRYPDGYCTASCAASEECGPGALCPVGDAVTLDPQFEARSTWPRTCYRRCSVDGAMFGGCRSGYVCRSLSDAYRLDATAPAPMRETICIPVPRSTTNP